MLSIAVLLLGAYASGNAASVIKRLDNGLATTPPMGWDSYNHYACVPNQSIVESNAKAMKDFGLADLGYHYVTTDCGWTLPHRTAEGKLTWNATLFPGGFPEMGAYIHSLGLGFGVYSDAGIQMCMNGLPNQTGSLFHEQTDANTFASWGADLLKYDNCYSSKSAGYPDADYDPTVSPAPRYRSMRNALANTGREILYQICEWGVDFPSNWAPPLGNSWRITNDIIPAWRTIFRQVNQFVPSAQYAGPGRWPDLDMLEVGNNVFTEPEEQTHFSLWAIAKSPLVMGCALNDTLTTVNPASLSILKNTDTIAINQDSLGKAANLTRRYSDAGFDVWAGPLSGDRTVVALVNWNNRSELATLHLPDAGVQTAGQIKDIWNNQTVTNVVTSYSAELAAHGVLLLELADTTAAGTYDADRCGKDAGGRTVFNKVYGVTDSDKYTLTINLAGSGGGRQAITMSSSADSRSQTVHSDKNKVTVNVALRAGDSNSISVESDAEIESIDVTPPAGTFYPSTQFSISGGAKRIKCTPGLCAPLGSKITHLTETGYAKLEIASDASVGSSRFVELTYINNDVALSTSWTNGTNSRNITVAVNNNDPVRLEVPLSGRSGIFSPMKGWGDPATLGILVDGFGSSGEKDSIVVGNAGGDAGVQPLGADFVGLKIV